MANYNDLAILLVGNAAFQARVKLAANSKAKTIAMETADGLEVAPRKRYAKAFIQAPDERVNELVFFVALDPTIKAKAITDHLTDVSDGEIDAALSDAVWDKLAEALA